MDFVAHSDPFVRYAFWAGLISFLLAALTILGILLLRALEAWRARRKQRLLNTWRPLLVRTLAGERTSPPALRSGELIDFLYLWLHFHESLRGEAKDALNDMLHAQQLLDPMCRTLKRGSIQHKLVVATALGHAHGREAWSELESLAHADSPVLSMTAARALMLIDAEAAADIVIPLILQRRDWSPARLAIMLNEVEQPFVERFLQTVNEAANTKAPYLVRLLHLVEAMGLNRPLPFVAKLLRAVDQPEIIAACLRMLNDPTCLPLVRALASHPHWIVRVQVANVLRRLGSREDLPSLLQLLCAPEWWVRYRAAQAITAAPYLGKDELGQLQATQADRYARDILQQVAAERSYI